MVSEKGLREELRRVLDQSGNLDVNVVRQMVGQVVREWEIEQGWQETNKGAAWTDDELRVVLSDAPLKENCLKHARAFGRGYGSIEQIYRWASTSKEDIERKRPNDIFISQIKRVAKQLGWRA